MIHCYSLPEVKLHAILNKPSILHFFSSGGKDVETIFTASSCDDDESWVS